MVRLKNALAVAVVLALSSSACAEDSKSSSTPSSAGQSASAAQSSPGAASSPAAQPTSPIRIGAVLDITGPGASLGGPQRTALQMLAKRLNDTGGIKGRNVELLIEDNQSTEDGAARAANKLIGESKVDILLGSSRTGPSLAMRPLAEAAKTPMISLAANRAIVDKSQWVFKTAPNDSVVLQGIIDYAAAQKWKSIGLLRDSSAFGAGVDTTLTELGGKAGITVAASEQFAPDATDYTAQIVKLRNAKADANLIWGIPPASGLAQKAYRQLGLSAPVIHSHGSASQAFLTSAEKDADGALVAVGRLVVANQLKGDDPQSKAIAEFVAAFKPAAEGKEPSSFAGYAHDAFQLAVDAFTMVGTDKQAVRDHLEQVTGFVGVSGTFNMSPENHSGLGPDSVTIATVVDSAWRVDTK